MLSVEASLTIIISKSCNDWFIMLNKLRGLHLFFFMLLFTSCSSINKLVELEPKDCLNYTLENKSDGIITVAEITPVDKTDQTEPVNLNHILDNNISNNNKKNEIFLISQNMDKIDIKSFSSRQLRNPEKIKLIENLNITLDLEYGKFVHLKIKDASEKDGKCQKLMFLIKNI